LNSSSAGYLRDVFADMGTADYSMNLPFAGRPCRAGAGRKCEYRLLSVNDRLCGIADLHMKVGERQVLDEFCRSSANNMAPQLVQVNV